jgi:biopolymer transport protein TolR
MAAHLAKAIYAAPGRRRRARGKRGPIADINMTPFIDVMLVLLIVFMIAAPLLATGVPLDLPQTTAGPINIDRKPLTVSIDERGRVFLNDQTAPVADIVARLREAAKQGPDERIYVRGHKRVDYGRVAEVMSTITAAGFRRVALVTEPGDGK